ncbi:MAG: DUF1573 domain-containing protein [Aquabacterium sp.]|nr:DUF1573 domain-containing protein [Ferruginibacter sp.]
MKKILLSAAVFALTATAFSQKKVDDMAKFTTETINLGKIKQGVPTKGVFTVTNVSNQPLIIEQANPTCGCTISDYTKEPIAAGKSGVINATYNAANLGHFDKHLTVKFAGIDEMKSITLTGDVVAAEEMEKAKPAEMKEAVAVPATPVKAVKKTKKTKK